MPNPYFSNPACDDALRSAKIWLDDCVLNHEQCNRSSNANLPKRILEIENRKIFLRHNLVSRLRGIYACLSHCWGPQGPLTKLTSFSEAKLSNGVLFEELPKTFAEAAMVCSNLNIPYLWIDALCKLLVYLMRHEVFLMCYRHPAG